MSRNMPDTLIIGRPIAPTDSWWATADGPQGFTAYVEREHLARMRCSKFSLLEPRSVMPREQPASDDYLYQMREA